MARKDPLLGAEGAVLFLEKVSPAIEQVDSSSGAIGTAVDRAIEALVAIIAAAPADQATRERWLARLWQAIEDDDIPYLETLGEHWGELCASREIASRWADELLPICRLVWSPDRSQHGYFKGTTLCLEALLAAGRHDELFDLLAMAPFKMWDHRQYAARALAAQGRTDDAIREAEGSRGLNDSPVAIARECEAILLAAGRTEEAFTRHALLANRATTYAAWFRAVAEKYPEKTAEEILDHLVAGTPGDEGKWFAAAKNAGLYDQAIALASRTPCAPQTLTRAARDFAEKQPRFAVAAGLLALYWLVLGHGYEVTGQDVLDAHDFTLAAAANAGCTEQTRARIAEMVASETIADRFVSRMLQRYRGAS